MHTSDEDIQVTGIQGKWEWVLAKIVVIHWIFYQ